MQTEGKDAFGVPIRLGDEVGTVNIHGIRMRGIVIKFGKAGVKIQANFGPGAGKSGEFGQSWITYRRAIKTRSRAQIDED
jgi:hypothetical protein